MRNLPNLPVIVGSGLTGMLISDSLSRSRIQHVLIGAPPTAVPRLGESLDGVGSRQLIRTYPQFQRFFHPKKHIVGLFGNYVMGIYLEPPPKVHWLAKVLLGLDLDDYLIHVDRMGFDCALYEHICASEYCTFIDSYVESLSYDSNTDRIGQLNLTNGETLAPGFVYDCTNHVRLLGKALPIPVQFISDAQRVIFTHFQADAKSLDSEHINKWQHATNLLLLCAEWDMINGAAWAIPLGSYISVGVSIPFQEKPMSDTEVIGLLVKAFARRGLNIQDSYPTPSKIMSIPRQQYFLHERAFGANWMLAGTTFGQAWFPTSSGFGAALIAARLALDYLSKPGKVGSWYENYMRRITDVHALFDNLFTGGHASLSKDGLQRLVDGLVTNNLERVLRNEQLYCEHLKNAMTRLATEIVYRNKVGKNWGRILQVELNQQMARFSEQEWRTWRTKPKLADYFFPEKMR